ncbi:MAG TPA: hypothetical protein VF316_02690 [Polyangiaceae bacterium]
MISPAYDIADAMRSPTPADAATTYGCKDDCVRADDAGGPDPMVMAGGWSSPFPREATAKTLADIASKLASCRTPGGPTGAGKVKIVFEPTGKVSAVELIEGPYRGTATGDCVLESFRWARVPPFDGSAVPANKSFMVPEN